MIILAAETSSPQGSLALIKSKDKVDEITWDRAESHSEIITLNAQKLLKKNHINFKDIDLFATGIGPGSFTGLRVAINFIKTCAYINNRPAFAANTLELIASNADTKEVNIRVAICAFRNLIYTATYKRAGSAELQELDSPRAMTIDEFKNLDHKNYLLLGDLEVLYPAVHKLLSKGSFLEVQRAHAQNFKYFYDKLLDQGMELPWTKIQPLYVRASEAEEKLREK